MKKLLLLLVVLACAYWQMRLRHTQQETDSATSDVEQVAAVSPSPATPARESVTATPIPAEPTPRPLAPAGVYYLVQRVSVTTDGGVTAFNPGTRVDFVSGNDAIYRVKVGAVEFDVSVNSVTNDLERAAEVVLGHNAAIASASLYRAQQHAGAQERENELNKQKRAEWEDAERARKRVASAPINPKTYSNSASNPLNRKAYDQVERKERILITVTPYSERIRSLQARRDDINRPLVNEQVTGLSEGRKAELQQIEMQLKIYEDLDRAYRGIPR